MNRRDHLEMRDAHPVPKNTNSGDITLLTHERMTQTR